MNYIEVKIDLSQFTEPMSEILMAELGEIEYESFIEQDDQLKAYIVSDKYNEAELNAIADQYGRFTYTPIEIEQLNWNAQWESSFEPILIDNFCHIRAPFHNQRSDMQYEIVIEPKMSFGTGHHATTRLMIKHMQTIDFKGKTVLDMGCGTGILAIMAKYLGAKSVHGIDIDEWAVENSIENAQRNGISDISFQLGIADQISERYDVILANINRNILVNDMEKYSKHLTSSGIIVFSGFYEADMPIIENEASKWNLKKHKMLFEDSWTALVFNKE